MRSMRGLSVVLVALSLLATVFALAKPSHADDVVLPHVYGTSTADVEPTATGIRVTASGDAWNFWVGDPSGTIYPGPNVYFWIDLVVDGVTMPGWSNHMKPMMGELIPQEEEAPAVFSADFTVPLSSGPHTIVWEGHAHGVPPGYSAVDWEIDETIVMP